MQSLEEKCRSIQTNPDKCVCSLTKLGQFGPIGPNSRIGVFQNPWDGVPLENSENTEGGSSASVAQVDPSLICSVQPLYTPRFLEGPDHAAVEKEEQGGPSMAALTRPLLASCRKPRRLSLRVRFPQGPWSTSHPRAVKPAALQAFATPPDPEKRSAMYLPPSRSQDQPAAPVQERTRDSFFAGLDVGLLHGRGTSPTPTPGGRGARTS